MRICILTQTFPKYPGDDTASFMRSLVEGIRKTNNEVIVLVPYFLGLKPNSFPFKIEYYKYIWPDSLHVLGYSSTLRHGAIKLSAYLLSPLFFFFAIIKLIRMCKREKIDIISAHWILPNGFIAAIACFFLDIPYVVTLPGSDTYVARKNNFFSLMAKFAAKKASAIVADSPKYLQELESLKVSVIRKEIIAYPVDIDELIKAKIRKNVRRELNLKTDSVVVLAVGRLVEKKGFTYLIRSMEKLKKSSPNVFLIIVGEGDIREQLEQLISQLDLNKNVFLVGSKKRNELINFYADADIFVCSSIKDSKGNMDDRPVSLIEAMVFGKPIIATDFPGIRLTVENRKSGILVKEKNEEALYEAIKKLANNKTLREIMGINGRKIAYDNFTKEKIGARYNVLFFNAIRAYEKAK